MKPTKDSKILLLVKTPRTVKCWCSSCGAAIYGSVCQNDGCSASTIQEPAKFLDKKVTEMAEEVYFYEQTEITLKARIRSLEALILNHRKSRENTTEEEDVLTSIEALILHHRKFKERDTTD